MFDEELEEECGSIIGDILVGFGIFFLVIGIFKLIFAAIEAFFILLSFLFNCILWVFYKAKLIAVRGTGYQASESNDEELASYGGRSPYAHGLAALVMIVGGLSLFMGNDASNVSANESYRMNREVVQTKPAKLPLLQAKVLATKLNARKEPHTKGKILYKLQRNQSVDVYMKQDGWWLVDVNGVRAWTSAKYLRAQ
ncbi:SH3 domain-containing protein [Vibrio breoganii]|uniref:SH3 domain-containing protein n=1 Tax=Vibrio breoganii TaxID=553239 RepID=UPI000C82133F|nr:SH3 domain-containing protein [Vibrio breoganii]PMI18027.1 hypothetical protein BCU49_01140 [Vibrio breoganii]PML94712.1 hypothetical protein BCT64_10835 [Vibrio breoganii]PMN64182.1 hypothetical protein BCT28_00500 [Vibrio breoganii]